MDFIKELYNGKIIPWERKRTTNSELDKMSESCLLMYREIRQQLDNEIAAKFDKLFEINSEMTSLESEENYIMGFRDGAKLMLDVLMG